MKKNDLVRKAEYIDIMLSLMSKPYNINSITKLIFVSFCVRHMLSFKSRTNNIVEEFFSNLSIKFQLNYYEIDDILWVIELLEKNKMVEVEGDNIQFVDSREYKSKNELLKQLANRNVNPILEVNKLDASAVIEEVIRYV